MDLDYIREFEVAKMIENSDWEDEEGMLYLSAKIRDFGEQELIRMAFEEYCQAFDKGIRIYEISPADAISGIIETAYNMYGQNGLMNVMCSIMVAAGWHRYYDLVYNNEEDTE